MKKPYIFIIDLRAALSERDISHAELGRRIGVCAHTVYSWVNGISKGTSLERIKQIAKVLKMKPQQIARLDHAYVQNVIQKSQPCGMTRALEIIGKDYLNSTEEHVRSVHINMPFKDGEGRMVQT